MPTQYEIIKERINSLQTALLDSHPQMPVLLREIHQNLKNDPELVTLLQPEDIRVIVNGLEKQTTVTLVSSMTKSSASKSAGAKSAVKGMTADDLF